jgi:hypothetical protein
MLKGVREDLDPDCQQPFSMTDAANRAGVLSGGALGKTEVIAKLLCSLRDNKIAGDSNSLAVGEEAIFLPNSRVPFSPRRVALADYRR